MFNTDGRRERGPVVTDEILGTGYYGKSRDTDGGPRQSLNKTGWPHHWFIDDLTAFIQGRHCLDPRPTFTTVRRIHLKNK